MTPCDTGNVECDACGRPRCPRCGRCCERTPTMPPGRWTYHCPSWPCAVAKKLSRIVGRPYTKRDTPEAA